MPSARECGSGAGLDSNRIERTPWRARPRARAKPTGPPPTIRTGDSFMTGGNVPESPAFARCYQRRAIRRLRIFVTRETPGFSSQNRQDGRSEQLFHVLILRARDFFKDLSVPEPQEMYVQKIETLSSCLYAP